MTISPSARTPNDFIPLSANAVTQPEPAAELHSLPPAWEAPPLMPRAGPVRIVPQPVAWQPRNQSTALRGFGINE